ncbi:unnamed protein product [Mesocestoides corti]|uniref:Nuclear cap-binding protein subunit 3 n=1 Tax=Mesocestoides corti TaxID=53468 RepID=A0A3P6GTW6_MESCO|nr:unnamed protein product [Mesocestoides corti]
MGVTEYSAKKLYAHLGFANGRDTMVAEGYRMDVLHVWGTHELSTADLLEWLGEFSPQSVEWIDDSSCTLRCNIIMINESTVLHVLHKLAEPFDRRVALTAMAAVISTMNTHNNGGDFERALRPPKLSPVEGTSDRLMPPCGRWFKSISSPERALCLYLRIAHKG